MSSTICIATVYIHSFRNRNGGNRTVGRPARNICNRIRFSLACPNRSEVAGLFLRLANEQQAKSAYLLGTRCAFFGVGCILSGSCGAFATWRSRTGCQGRASLNALFQATLNITRSRYLRSRQSSSFQIQSPLQMRGMRSESERQTLAMTRSDWFRPYPGGTLHDSRRTPASQRPGTAR